MSSKDIKWLTEIFPEYKNKVLRGVNLDAYSKAEMLIMGKSSKPECSCSYNSYKLKIDSFHDRWVKQNT